MIPSTVLLFTVFAQVPIQEPVWIGTEAVIRVKINAPHVEPLRPSGPPDHGRVSPIILLAVNPMEKDPTTTARVYEIRYVGLQAGEHDLRDYLNFAPEANRQMSPPILVSIGDPLPPDHHGQLATPPVLERAVGGPSWPARAVLGVAAVWSAVLAIAGFVVWRKWPRRVMIPPGPAEDGLLERLGLAEVKRLTPQGVAALERELLDRWRRELGLADSHGVALIRGLEKDIRGRALLAALEDWRARLESGPAPMPPALKEWAGRSTRTLPREVAAR